MVAYRRARIFFNVVIVALILSNTALIVLAYLRNIEQTQAVNGNLASVVLERVEASLGEIDHLLGATIHDHAGRLGNPQERVALQVILTDRVRRIEQLHALYVVDEDDRLLAMSSLDPVSTASSARDPIHGLVGLGMLAVGAPLVSPESGERVIPVAMPFSGEHGSGHLVAALNLRTLSRLLERIDIGRGSITFVIGDHIAARKPATDLTEEIQVPAELRALLLRQHHGQGDVRSPVDGVQRLFSFERSSRFRLLVLVGSSKFDALQGWMLQSALQTLWTALLCLLLMRAGQLAQRALTERLLAEQALSAAHDRLAVANDQLRQLAQRDGLTGLANRRYFEERLAREIRISRREGTSLSLVLIDVDEFKRFNDHYGHVAGDQCLRSLAAVLETATRRPEDLVARYGGEEFALLLPNTDAEGARVIAEMARSSAEGLRLEHAACAAGWVTLSLGVASRHPASAQTAEHLVHRADMALYDAKRSGKNRVEIADPEP